MGEGGVLRGALRACAARERAEYVNVRNVYDRLFVPGMHCSLNLNAFRYMLCDIYADACRAASVKARVPNADCVMCWRAGGRSCAARLRTRRRMVICFNLTLMDYI